MPKTSAATATSLTAAGSTVVAGPTPRNDVHIQVNLVFENVTFSPVALHTALDAAYGTVTSDTDGAERPMGPYNFRIAP